MNPFNFLSKEFVSLPLASPLGSWLNGGQWRWRRCPGRHAVAVQSVPSAGIGRWHLYNTKGRRTVCGGAAAGLERSRRLPRGPNPTQAPPGRQGDEGRGHCMGHCPHCSQAGFPAGRGPCPPSPRPAGTAMTPSIEILNLKLAPPASWNQACRRDHVERSQEAAEAAEAPPAHCLGT